MKRLTWQIALKRKEKNEECSAVTLHNRPTPVCLIIQPGSKPHADDNEFLSVASSSIEPDPACLGSGRGTDAAPPHTSKPCHRLAFSLGWLKLMAGWHDCDLYGFVTLAGTVPRLHVSSAFLTNPPGSPRNPRCRMHNLRGGRRSIPKNTNDMGGREKGGELQREEKKRAAAKLPGCVHQRQSSVLTSNPGMSFLSWHETSAKPE